MKLFVYYECFPLNSSVQNLFYYILIGPEACAVFTCFARLSKIVSCVGSHAIENETVKESLILEKGLRKSHETAQVRSNFWARAHKRLNKLNAYSNRRTIKIGSINAFTLCNVIVFHKKQI